jgi:hypothetical protein
MHVDHALLSELTDGSAIDARMDALEATDVATDTRLDTVESRAGHADRSPFVDLTTGRYNCVDGDDITAELLDALRAGRQPDRARPLPPARLPALRPGHLPGLHLTSRRWLPLGDPD